MRTTTNLPPLVLLELPGLTPTVWGEPCEAGSEEGGAGGMVGDWREERMDPGSPAWRVLGVLRDTNDHRIFNEIVRQFLS